MRLLRPSSCSIARGRRRTKWISPGRITPEGEGEAPNRYSEATGAFAYTIHGYRHSDRKHKILMILFITSVLGSVFAGLVCLFFKQFVAAYALFGCFGLILLIGIGAAIIASRR